MKKTIVMIAVIGAAVASLSGCDMYPPYRVYSQRMEGEAELAKQQYAKQVLVQEAEAKKQAAQAYADAEVIRAQGVAKANKIIGDSLRDNESYLRYLWINNMGEDKGKTVVYVPTEANLPILESQRLAQAGK